MTEPTIQCLRRWFLAHEAAKENPKPLLAIRGHGPEECERVSRLCADRMAECAACLTGSIGLSLPLLVSCARLAG